MIEIERAEKPEEPLSPDAAPKYRWHIRQSPTVWGTSREPLLAACRVLIATGVDPGTEIGVFRPGRTDWDMRTTVGYGSNWTVKENQVRPPQFVPYRKFGE